MIFDAVVLTLLSYNCSHVRIENDWENFWDYLGLQYGDSSNEQSLRHFRPGKACADDCNPTRLRLSKIIRESFHVIHGSDRKYAVKCGTRNGKSGRTGSCGKNETAVLQVICEMILRLHLYYPAVRADLCRSDS